MSLNKVMLIGNVGADPEVRYLESQAKVARLRIATTESYTDRNGEKRENTEWHTVTCWRRLADLCEKYVKQGTQLYIAGRLQTREWNDQSGAKRYTTEIVADNVQLLGRRADNQAPAQSPYGHPATQQPSYGAPQQQGGYQPYQSAYQQVTPGPAPTVSSPSPEAFGGDGDDDLPF